MNQILDEIEQALNNGLYLLALESCLTLPDICAALQANNGRTDSEKYKKWYKKYVYNKEKLWLDPNDAYLLRCSMLHQASVKPSPVGKQNATYTDFVFTYPDESGLMLDNCRFSTIDDDNCLNLYLPYFCHRMMDGVKRWETEMKLTHRDAYYNNYDNLVKKRPLGKAPYIVGKPIIS